MSLKSVGSIVMEKDVFLRDLLAVVPGAPMGHTTASTTHLDGLGPTGAHTAPPLPLTSPSGVSRPQFLVAAQAASLPCFPGYSDQDGGVVLDRQLLHMGGEHWWSTLTSRVKAQRLVAGRKSSGWQGSLADPANYALCHNTFVRLPQQAVLRTKLTYMPGTPPGSNTTSSKVAATQPAQLWGWQAPAWVGQVLKHRRHMSAAASLRRKLRHSELRVEAHVNQQGVDPGARTTPLPFQAVVELRSPSNQLSSLQYRLGVQHLMTKPGSQQAATSTHLHAALGLQGNRCLWSGNASARRANNGRRHAVGRRRAGTAGLEARLSSAAAGPGNGSALSRGKVLGPHNPIRQVLQRLLRGAGDSPQVLPQQDLVTVGEEASGAGAEGLLGLGAGLQGLLGAAMPQPEEMQEAVMDATQSIKRLREDVQSLADWVSSGTFTQQLEERIGIKSVAAKPRAAAATATVDRSAKRTVSAKPAAAAAAPPWSSLVGAPHLKVAGLMGLYLRQPLLPLSGGAGHGTAGRTSQAGSDTAGPGLMARANSLSSDLIRSSVTWLMHAATSLVQPDTYSGSSAGGWAPKVGSFASLAASAQLGWMQRPLLDFTRASARLDLGLLGQPPLPITAGITEVVDSSSRSRARDWSWQHGPLPCWHALTLSLSQQVVGPLRLCADLRYSLEPGGSGDVQVPPRSPPSSLGGGQLQSQPSESVRVRTQQAVAAQLQGAAAQVRSTRPQLVDAAVALDLVIPGSSGFARIVAWFAPMRKEGMLELRLL